MATDGRNSVPSRDDPCRGDAREAPSQMRIGLRVVDGVNRVAVRRPALGALLGVLLIEVPILLVGLLFVPVEKRLLIAAAGVPAGWIVTLPNVIRARAVLKTRTNGHDLAE